MPARDFYYDVVKAALIADGSTITHDPLLLHVGKKNLFVNVGAERLLAADKGGRKIVVTCTQPPLEFDSVRGERFGVKRH